MNRLKALILSGVTAFIMSAVALAQIPAQPTPSVGGVFNPLQNYVVAGVWTFLQRPVFYLTSGGAVSDIGTSAMVPTVYTNATTTFSNVTGLSFPVLASRNYHAICRIEWQGSAATSGPKYQWTGPASPTSVASGMNSVVTATTVIAASVAAFSTPMANTGTVTTATNFTDTVDVGVVNGVNAGTVQLQAASNGAGTLTIQPGSSCFIQ